jgi:hypothetical protein
VKLRPQEDLTNILQATLANFFLPKKLRNASWKDIKVVEYLPHEKTARKNVGENAGTS